MSKVCNEQRRHGWRDAQPHGAVPEVQEPGARRGAADRLAGHLPNQPASGEVRLLVPVVGWDACASCCGKASSWLGGEVCAMLGKLFSF